MKTRWFLIVVALLNASLLLLLLAPLVPASAASKLRYVALDDDCGGEKPCYASLQKALDAAKDGDEIRVAMGVYTQVHPHAPPPGYDGPDIITQGLYIDVGVTVRGGYTITDWTTPHPLTQPTIIDTRQRGRALFIASGTEVQILDLYFKEGDATALGGGAEEEDAGGGIYVWDAPVTISGCQVLTSTAYYGSGLYLYASEAKLYGNKIAFNTSGWDGGGLYARGGDVKLYQTHLISNVAKYGGGLYAYESDVEVGHSVITGNIAHASGGGLFIHKGQATIAYNTVRANTTGGEHGGGLYLWDSTATLDNNLVLHNTAEAKGGGLFIWLTDAELSNNIVADNTSANGGTGLYIQGASPKIRQTTIAHNPGGSGVHVTNDGDYYSTVMMTNTILVSHTVGISVTQNNTATLEATLWGNATNEAGAGDILTGTLNGFGPPDFLDPLHSDYHIGDASAAIDVGVFSDVPSDIDEENRPMGAGYDLGADEYPDALLKLEQAAHPLWLNPGQTVTYTLTVANLGGQATSQVRLTDTLPTLQQFITLTTSQGDCTIEGGQALCDIGTILPGYTIYLTLTTQTTDTIPGGISALPLYMDNVAIVKASNTVRQSASAETVLQNCHVRLNDQSTAYPSVQAAVDASTSSTDIVKVAGYCIGVNTSHDTLTQHAHISRSLILRGGYTTTNWTTPYPLTQPTTLDALGRGRVLFINNDDAEQTINLVIESLSITGGDAKNLGGYIDSKGKVYNTGGGICAISATVTLSDTHIVGNRTGWSRAYGWGGGVYMAHSNVLMIGNVIANNVADAYSDPDYHFSDSYGGGLYLRESTGTFRNNTFISNTATWEGGGLYVLESPVTLSANTFQSNTALIGAGLLILDSEAELNDNAFYHNVAENGMGGGLSLSSSSATLTGNTFSENVSGYGGGINLTGHSVGHFMQNLILGNHSTWKGGGIRLNGSAVLINNIIAENETDGSGGAIFADDTTLRGYHNTFVANTADDNTGIYVDNSVVSVTNSILVSHTVGISVTNKSALAVEGILWYNTPITIAQEADTTAVISNASWGDPAFSQIDNPTTPAEAYHLTPGSAAIDAGVPTTITHDIDADPRPYGNAPDLGVDEILATAAYSHTESTLVYTDTGGGVTDLWLPSGAVTDTVVLVYTPIESVTVPLSYTFANHAFELSAYRGGALLPDFTFLEPLEVTLHYTDDDVTDLDEARLMLYVWNERTSAWQDAACAAYTRVPDRNRLTIPICHVGIFVLVEPPPPPDGPTEPTSLVITGPSIGLINVDYTFTATVDVATTTPITYTWQAENHDIVQHTSDELSDTAVFSWTSNDIKTDSLKTIFVTATNGKGWVAKSRHIAVFVPVKAAFTSSVRSGIAPLRVAFTDTSESVITEWHWDFGDGAKRTAQNPEHTYTAPGTYTVSLGVSGPAGSDSVTRTGYIAVSAPPPVAALSGAPLEGKVPLSVQFADLSEGQITKRVWDFGDGVTSTVQHPSHIYTATGIYTVSLFVSGPGGVDHVTHTHYITVTTVPPTARFTGAPLTGVKPLTVVFTNTSDVGQSDSLSYVWDFGDGVTSTQQHPTHTYTTPGTYTISLSVSGSSGTDKMTRVRYITVLESPPKAAFTGTPLAGSPPLTITFTDQSESVISQWLWDFGDGVTSTARHPTHLYTQAGVFTVRLTVSGPGGYDTETKTAYVHVSESVPIVNYTATPTEGAAPLNVRFTDTSEGTITRWLWDFGDGVTSTVQHPTHLYASVGIYTVTLTTTGPGGTDTLTRARYITAAHAPLEAAFIGSPLTGQAPLTVVFTNTSQGVGQAVSLSTTGQTDSPSYVWDFGDGMTSTAQHPTHTYTQTGAFTVRLTVSRPDAHDTMTKVNYVHAAAPQVQAGFVATPTEGLAPLSINFADMSKGVIPSGPWISTWAWNFGDGAKSSARNPTHVYAEAGVYTVSLTVDSLSNRHTLTQTKYIWVNHATTHHVEIPSAPVTGGLNTPITFTAKFTPIRPLSSLLRYTWQATGHTSEIEETHRLTSTATFMWHKPGLKTVSIAVSEVGGTTYAQNTYYITIEGKAPTPTRYIYLPLVMQKQP